MKSGGTRLILRTAGTARREIQELLAGVLAAELVVPSTRLWLVSPWLRDVPILDNRSAAFRGIGPGWARREIGLFDILAEILRRGSEVTIATRPERETVFAILRRMLGERSVRRLNFVERSKLHTKGLLGEDYCIIGSMNFTQNGVEVLEELVRYTTNVEEVGELRLEFASEYGENR